jgi:hypothetical protein
MFKHILAAAVLFAFALVLAAQSPAQNWNNVRALSVGTSVRISVGSRTIAGQVQRVTDDSLVVDSGKGQEMFTRQEVMRVSTNTSSRLLVKADCSEKDVRREGLNMPAKQNPRGACGSKTGPVLLIDLITPLFVNWRRLFR